MVKNEKDSSELIASLCMKVAWVGPGKAFTVAEYIDNNWAEFLELDSKFLLSIEKKGGRSVLTDEQAKEIEKIKAEFKSLKSVRDAWIYLIGKDFLITQISMLQSVSLENLDINPPLMKVLNLKTKKEVLEFNLYQSVTRSIVTSWGSAVESLLVRCGAESFEGKSEKGRAGRRPDIVKKVGNKIYYIQVKSGPNTMNVDMVNSLNEVISEYKKNKPNTEFLLGMTYGKRKRISSQIRDNLLDFDNSSLIGRELWDFISEKKNFHTHLFGLLDSSSSDITPMTFSEHLDSQLNVLLKEWQKKYGNKKLDDIFENYL